MNVTVVVPMFNSSSTILASLNSVIQQKYTHNVEIIVVDDGSTDDSWKIVNNLKSNVDFDIRIISKENGGVSSARNVGIYMAKYEWIAFLDSDDIWLPEKLEKQRRSLEEIDFNVDFIGCARNDEVLYLGLKRIRKLHKATVKELLFKTFPQTSTALVRKSVLLSLGGYDETFSHAEDGELWLRICSDFRFYYLPESLVITGGGKANFGESGLSANLVAMNRGVNRHLKLAFSRGDINLLELMFFRVFYFFKSIRRRIIAG